MASGSGGAKVSIHRKVDGDFEELLLTTHQKYHISELSLDLQFLIKATESATLTQVMVPILDSPSRWLSP